MIKDVYLFTNRAIAVFDEHGDQITAVQREFGYSYAERGILEAIKRDDPHIHIARWPASQGAYTSFCYRISFQELCYLLGHGQWYENNYGYVFDGVVKPPPGRDVEGASEQIIGEASEQIPEETPDETP